MRKSTTASTGVAGTAPVVSPAVPANGQVRAVIDRILPAVDGGRFAVKCVAGEPVVVQASCFTDGHDMLRVLLCWRNDDDTAMREVEMRARGSDVWEARFVPPQAGRYRYTVVAWVDAFESWRDEMVRRVEGDDIRIAAQAGAQVIAACADRADGADRRALAAWVDDLQAMAGDTHVDARAVKILALDEMLAQRIRSYPDRSFETVYPVELPLVADRERARFSSWYELFPRSCAPVAGQHGTFKDVMGRLPAIAAMGFDVLYFPPIHPIGTIRRKGKNNTLEAGPDDVGSPWAIGSAQGGHKAILSALGTPADFRSLVHTARELGIDVALDIAFQCAPDHPYVKAHPDWFRWRPDGTVQYAENPPKKYQDIYPFNFESEDWQALWLELKSVFEHWIDQGVTIFRVDNPHTKSFAFWEWVIGAIKHEHPTVIFLAEAFTRPAVMHRLAKVGFTQSYTYFTWRNQKHELQTYFTELAGGPGKAYFRPNAWPNTPDILHEQLQTGEPAVYIARLVLAATLAASYGIYGPAYELRDHTPREPGSEEYLDSEKYQLRHWDHDDPGSLAPFITRINRIRRENRALHSDSSLRFLPIDNDQLLAYTKATDDASNVVVIVVNLDPQNTQGGWLEFDPASIQVDPQQDFQMHDLLSNQRFTWRGSRHYLQIDPHNAPAHIFVVRRRIRDERDFDYYF